MAQPSKGIRLAFGSVSSPCPWRSEAPLVICLGNDPRCSGMPVHISPRRWPDQMVLTVPMILVDLQLKRTRGPQAVLRGTPAPRPRIAISHSRISWSRCAVSAKADAIRRWFRSFPEYRVAQNGVSANVRWALACWPAPRTMPPARPASSRTRTDARGVARGGGGGGSGGGGAGGAAGTNYA